MCFKPAYRHAIATPQQAVYSTHHTSLTRPWPVSVFCVFVAAAYPALSSLPSMPQLLLLHNNHSTANCAVGLHPRDHRGRSDVHQAAADTAAAGPPGLRMNSSVHSSRKAVGGAVGGGCDVAAGVWWWCCCWRVVCVKRAAPVLTERGEAGWEGLEGGGATCLFHNSQS